jgi:hypothetical protein
MGQQYRYLKSITLQSPRRGGGYAGYGPRPSDGKQAHVSNASVTACNKICICNRLTLHSRFSLAVQAFIADVKNALLFGSGDPIVTFRDMLNLQIPADLDAAWFAQTVEEWEAAVQRLDHSEDSHSFVGLLKELWRPNQPTKQQDSNLSGSISLMYGILAVARQVVHREDTILSQRADCNASSLNVTVENSLALWEQAWRDSSLDSGLPWMIPTCTCVLQLGRSTLYEISPADLQLVAGKATIEGRRKGPADYNKSLRKIRLWAREARGRRAVASERSFLGARHMC